MPTAANVAYYAEIVLDHYVKRLTITEAKGFFEKAKQSGDTADMIASLQDPQNKLSDRTLKGKDFHVIGDVCIQCLHGEGISGQIQFRSNWNSFWLPGPG